MTILRSPIRSPLRTTAYSPLTGKWGAPLAIARTMGATTFSKTDLEAFDTWNGAAAGITGLYTNHDTWVNFEANVDVWIAEYDGDTRQRMLACPLNVDAEADLSGVIAGDHDDSFTYFFTQHLAAYPAEGSIFVCLGWEPNFSWAWSGDGEDYIAAWQRIVALGRGISSRFKFVWVMGISAGHTEPMDAYWPGASWVDVVGMTYYARAVNMYPSAADEWTTAKEQTWGIDWVVSHASSNGKPLAFMEYGTDYDDPDTVTLTAAFIAANPFVFHIWFDNSQDVNFDTKISDDSLFDVGEAFVSEYGVPSYGTSVVQPVHITSSPWGDSNVSTSGIRVSSTGNEFGYRSYYPSGAPIATGAYQLQVLYEYVDPNATAFVPLSTDGAVTQNVGFTISSTTPTPYADQGSGFTDVSLTELDDGKLLLQANITIDAHTADFNCGIGPMSTTNGRAVDVHGFRLRPVL